MNKTVDELVVVGFVVEVLVVVGFVVGVWWVLSPMIAKDAQLAKDCKDKGGVVIYQRRGENYCAPKL